MKKKLETYEEMTEELNKRTSYLEVSVDNLITILQYILEIVELTKAKGPQKKTLAITLLKYTIDKAEISVNEKDNCYILINNGTIANTIDLVISASKKKIKLNKYRSIFKRILHKYKKGRQARYLQEKFNNRNRNRRNKRNKKNKKNKKNKNNNCSEII